MNVNKFGRSYNLGKSLDNDLRRLIIDECLKSGGDATFGYLPVTYVSIASRFNVSANTVSKIWKKFCYEGRNINPSPRGGDRSSKFSEGDLELLEVLRKRKARHNSMNYILYLRNLVIVVEFLHQLFHEQLNLDFCLENDILESVSLVLLLNALLMKI